ncbi:SusD/RagB family nutrient-binding outer membrane lipoprotein [Alistipes sp.]|uniref:SusD/RagB family nutrient-binding outer membrane lipoprotein n=1 Tax=Alistipes sp. TaxID=1872444 RepID=UPI003AEF4126
MKYISITKTALAAAALAAASCTANFEDINRNPYEVTGEEMERDGYNMRSFLTTMQSWVIPTDVNQCQFTDLLLGGPYGGYIADANSGFNTGKFSTYDPQSNWSEVFYRVIYTHQISNFSELCKVTEDEKAIAVAKVVKVAGVHRVADTYGPIPYTKVGTGVDPVPLDSEEEVYTAMFKDLNEAIEVLTRNRTNMISADADRLYGGNLEKWGRLANSLKLRLAMRIVYANPTLAKEMAEQAVSSELGVIESNADNAMYTGFGKDGNPFYVCFFSYKSGQGDHRIAADITSFMNGYDDPRRDNYFSVSTFKGTGITNGYIGLRNGIQIPEDDQINYYSLYKVTASTSLMWINASEVAFLRAEGALRNWSMGGDAQSFYEQGVRLSMERCGVADKTADYLASEAVPGSYNDPAFGFNYTNESTITIPWNPLNDGAFEENLERIITQKWIANFPLGSEAWADFRRTGYPRLFQVAVNNNPDITNLKLGARRLTYPLTEYEINGETIQAAVDQYLGGQDKMSVRLWWDCNPNVR